MKAGKIIFGVALVTVLAGGAWYLYRNRHIIAAKKTGAAMQTAPPEPVMSHIDVEIVEPVLRF